MPSKIPSTCDQVPILISGGVAHPAICHGHGQRLADGYRRLSSLTASGEQVIGVTAAVQRAVDSMERVVRDEARRNRDQMAKDHRDTVQRLERINTTLQRGNAALQTQIEGMETTMARNQHQLISTVQSTGRITTAAVNMSSDIAMRVGEAVLNQATRRDLKRKERDDIISAQLEKLIALKQKARQLISSEDPLTCTMCTLRSEPGEIEWSDREQWQCPMCSELNEYASVIPETLLPSLVA